MKQPQLRNIRFFLEQYGYMIVTGVCIAVIIGTAVWTGKQSHIQPETELHAASRLMQETMENASLSTPIATQPAWHMPLDKIELAACFSNDELVCYSNGIWQLHQAVDLLAEANAPVYAVCAGTISDLRQDLLLGMCVTLKTTGCHEITYAGLSDNRTVKLNDRVHAGQMIGYLSENKMIDAVEGSHLHLCMMQDGLPVDPLIYLTDAETP